MSIFTGLAGYGVVRQKWTKRVQESTVNARSAVEPTFESRTMTSPDGVRLNSTHSPL
jgi:hypothetical protein